MRKYLSISNQNLAKVNSSLYKILATIPEDPLYWTDSDCYAFDNAKTNIDFFLNKTNDMFVLVETFEKYENTDDIPHNEEGVDGHRQLLVFSRSDWEHINE